MTLLDDDVRRRRDLIEHPLTFGIFLYVCFKVCKVWYAIRKISKFAKKKTKQERRNKLPECNVFL